MRNSYGFSGKKAFLGTKKLFPYILFKNAEILDSYRLSAPKVLSNPQYYGKVASLLHTKLAKELLLTSFPSGHLPL
jgi:hypothetical protein